MPFSESVYLDKEFSYVKANVIFASGICRL